MDGKSCIGKWKTSDYYFGWVSTCFNHMITTHILNSITPCNHQSTINYQLYLCLMPNPPMPCRLAVSPSLESYIYITVYMSHLEDHPNFGKSGRTSHRSSKSPPPIDIFFFVSAIPCRSTQNPSIQPT